MKKMNSIIYKIMALAIVCLFATLLQAQQKHEFSIYGGGGLSTLNYKLNNVNSDKVKLKAGIVAGVGYTFFINSQWGITTGAEYTTYKSKSESYSILDTQAAVDDYDDNFDYIIFQKDRTEDQEVSYVNIPLMVQFQAQEGTGFYAALGGKIGLPMNGKYKYKYNGLTASGYYPSLNVLYEDLEYRGFGKFEGKSGKNDLDFKTAFILSAETGMKLSLGKKLFLYTGVYADYGLNDIVKDKKNKKLLPYNNENPLNPNNNSMLNSEYTYYWNKKPFAGKVIPLAVGIKLKVSFSVQ
jgi:hypothetical protein